MRRSGNDGQGAEPVAMSLHDLRPHPKLRKTFGTWSQKDYDRVKRSIIDQGYVEAIEITPLVPRHCGFDRLPEPG